METHNDIFSKHCLTQREIYAHTPISPRVLNFADGSHSINMGLSRREYFAAKIMQGLISSDKTIPAFLTTADWAVYLADDLIKSLNKEKISLNGQNIQP
jgi:hypothetical protein